jgi:uncharacterized membrane protein YdjX (TVP38/TMEM64 family)
MVTFVPENKKDHQKFLIRLFRLLGVASFIAAAALLVIVIIMRVPRVQVRYQQYLDILQNFEQEVAALGNRWLIIIVIFLLYILRSLTPIYPYPALYIMTGMVFDAPEALLIDSVGMAFTVAFRYYTGIEMGEGWMNAVLHRHPAINRAFTTEGKSDPWVLFALRFVPIFPFNTVSQLYGSFEYPFLKYFIISMVAYSYKLISYTFIGNNVYDPLSGRFYIPLIVLFVVSGISFFLMQAIMGLTFKFSKKNKSATQKGNTENE